MVKYDRLFHSKGRKKSCLSNGTIKSLNNNSPIDFSCESSDSLSNFGTGTARPSFALRQPISRPAISRANPDRTPGLAKTSALRAIVLPSRGSPNRSAALRLAYRTGGISLSSIFHSGEVPSEEVRRCARPNATGPLIETFSEEAILKKTKKNSSGGPPFVSVGHRAFHSIGGGRRSPAFPNHIRKIPIIHLFAGYTETRPDNKTLRKNGRQLLSPKIARPPYPSRENHGSFSPGTARDFQSESPPTVPHLEKRKPAASLGKRRQYPDSTGHSPMQAATRRIVGKVPSRLLRTCSGVHHRARSIPSSRCGAGCVQPTMRMRNQCVRLSSQLP